MPELLFVTQKYCDSNLRVEVLCYFVSFFFSIMFKLLTFMKTYKSNQDTFELSLFSSFFHAWITTLCSFTASDLQTCLTSNYCLHSVCLLEYNIKWSLLPLGILCSRWARPGRGQQAGGCGEGMVLPY